MDIEFKKTSDISTQEWKSYVKSYNQIFDKNFSITQFQQKYQKTIDSNSHHVFLKENNKIVGSCTSIPFEYYFKQKRLKTGLIVDVFILPEYRFDPMTLYRMYNNLTERLKKFDTSLTIAVPNDTIYPYWKSVAKWKDIGTLDYYVMPVNIAKFIGLNGKAFKTLSGFFARMMLFISNVLNSEESTYEIRLNREYDFIEEQRYHQEDTQSEIKESFLPIKSLTEMV